MTIVHQQDASLQGECLIRIMGGEDDASILMPCLSGERQNLLQDNGFNAKSRLAVGSSISAAESRC